MTDCLSKTGSWCLSILLRAMNSGVHSWRRLMPSRFWKSRPICWIVDHECIQPDVLNHILKCCGTQVFFLFFFSWYQAEWLLWGSVWRKHHRRLWGLHRWCVWDVRAPQRSQRSAQDNRQSSGERLSAGLLYRCKRWTHRHTAKTRQSMLHHLEKANTIKRASIYFCGGRFILLFSY